MACWFGIRQGVAVALAFGVILGLTAISGVTQRLKPTTLA
jgi:hypothetical protein